MTESSLGETMNRLRVDIIPPQPFRGKHDTTEHTPAEIRLIDLTAGEVVLMVEQITDAKLKDIAGDPRNWKEAADRRAHALRKALGLLKKFKLWTDLAEGPTGHPQPNAEVWARSAVEAFELLMADDKTRDLINRAKGFTLEVADG